MDLDDNCLVDDVVVDGEIVQLDENGRQIAF